MKFISSAVFIAAALLNLPGCNSSGDEPEKIIHGPSVVYETETVIYEIDNFSDGEWSVKTDEGNSVFVSSYEVEGVKLIVPNVAGDLSTNLSFFQNGTLIGKHQISIKNKLIPEIPEHVNPNAFASSNIGKYDKTQRDSLGIPLTYQGDVSYYFHIQIAKIAVDYYSYVLKNPTEVDTRNDFLAMANWLKDNCIYTSYGFCSWQSNLPLSAYKLPEQWTSAMGQGLAISALIGASSLTSDSSFAEVANDAIAAFKYPIELKGVTADFDGKVWYEEYGSEEMPAHVLNGFLFSMAGLWDAKRFLNSEQATELFNIGVDSLVANGNHFDLGFTSRYDYSELNQISSTKGTPNDHYHELHVFQLSWLYSISDRQEIYDLASKFLQYDMLGLQTNPKLSDESKKIINVTSSHTIEPVRYGIDKLQDGNWAWYRYWSSNRTGVEFSITLNQDVLKARGIESIAFTSLSIEDMPDNFDVYTCNDTCQPYMLGVDNTNAVDGFSYSTSQNHKSFSKTFNIFNGKVSGDKLKIVFNSSPSGSFRFREMNVHYQQLELMDKIVNEYKNR